LHGHRFPKNAEVVEIGEGEEAKTLDSVSALYDRFLEAELDRTSLVVGIGGGVVCDVAGFAASTYLRGVPFGFVPTTLLAQVDASIGGKNGVNLNQYKNLVGTIRQPRFCLMDFDLLKTLPPCELRSGFAEVVKCAAIRDAGLFSYLEQHFSDALALKKTAIEKVVSDSVTVKAALVTRDENEKGERMQLNFGHTFGHALEKATGLPHGEAVSIGMVVAARISVSRGMLSAYDADRMELLLRKLGLPVELKGSSEVVIDAIRKDKKRQQGDIRMVLLEQIGKAAIIQIKIEELKGVLHGLQNKAR
jgi:3-dehydroquinate synthase